MRRKVGTRAGAGIIGAVALAGIALMAGAPPASHPIHAKPDSPEAQAIWREALARDGKRIVVSIEQRRLWLLQGKDTVMTAPIAVGKGGIFRFADNEYRFDTPRGKRVVRAKVTDPNWIPPDWHYYEKAVQKGLEPVHLEDGDRVELADGTFIEVREKQVGRVNRWGNWWPFTPGSEIVFDGKIFVPPLGSAQRKVPNALGPLKLDMGNGYLIHGTHRYNTESIGSAASHGCVRMRNEDLERLYALVDVGTPVYIY